MYQELCWVGTAILQFTAEGKTEMLTNKCDKPCWVLYHRPVKGTVGTKEKRQLFLPWKRKGDWGRAVRWWCDWENNSSRVRKSLQ